MGSHKNSLRLGGLDRLKSWGPRAVKDIAMVDRLVLAVSNVLHDGARTTQLGVVRARPPRAEARAR